MELKALISVLVLLTGVVMTSGCGAPPQTNDTNPWGYDNIPDNIENETQNQTQQNNSQKTGNDNQATTSKSTTQSTSKDSGTSSSNKKTTQSDTPKVCSHSWVQEYAGYDSSTGKIKYKIYCKKCGEVANYVWY